MKENETRSNRFRDQILHHNLEISVNYFLNSRLFSALNESLFQDDREEKKRDARFRISHLARRIFFQLFFSHVKREIIFLNFSFFISSLSVYNRNDYDID